MLEKRLSDQKRQISGLGMFDAALDMQGLFKSALPIWLAKSDNKLGYHWQREGTGLMIPKVLPDKSSIHVVDQYVDVARALGAQCERATFGLAPAEVDIEYVNSLFESQLNNRPIVLMNAGAGWITKRWAPENFARLNDALQKLGACLAFLGTEGDRLAFEQVKSKAEMMPIDLLGKTNVRQLVALISLCKVHIGGDTGSTHIAAALSKPCVGIYTLTDPRRCCPYGQYDHSVYAEYNDVERLAISLLES